MKNLILNNSGQSTRAKLPSFIDEMLSARRTRAKAFTYGFTKSRASCAHIFPRRKLSPCWKAAWQIAGVTSAAQRLQTP
jgi:hypothetical protein